MDRQRSMKRGSRFIPLFLSIFIVSAFSLVTVGCPPPTTTTEKTPDVDGGGGTEKAPVTEGGDCGATAECVQGLLCKGGKCTKPECTTDADCTQGDKKKCIDYKCEAAGDQCADNTECPPGQDCEAKADGKKYCSVIDVTVESVLIVTPPGVVRSGQTRQFEAVALNKSGARLSGDFTFTWKSGSTDVAAIDAKGLATGGSTDGETEITAEIQGKTSAGVKLRNFAAVEAGKLRVILIDSDSKFVEGAKVMVGASEATSDAQGAAVIDTATLPADIHVFHKNYAFFSSFGVNKNDLLVQLVKKPDNSKAGGIKGKINFDVYRGIMGIPEDEWASYNVAVGFTSFSISSDILGLNLDTLLGESFETDVFGQKLSLPSGVVLEALGGGKPDFKTQSEPGKDRLAFALGAKLKVSDVTPLISQVTGGDGVDIGKILVAIEPLFDKMALGFQTGISVDVFAKVPDADDLNKNGKTDDLIPDFAKFTAQDLTVDKKLDKKITVNASSYPSYDFNGKPAEFYAISLLGVLLPGYGLAPLGIAIGKAENGKALTLRHAEASGVLRTGRYVTLTIALTLPLGDPKPPLLISGDLQFFDKAPQSLTISAFPKLPTTAKLDPASRTLSNAATEGSSFNQIDLSNDKGRWIVVYPSATAEVVLPAVPSGFDDPLDANSSASLRPVKLQGSITMDEILEFNDKNMDRLTEYLSGFANVSVYEKP
ncbi:MAG: hypothetical protein H6727_20390 [Myxococcales bacterium]|nr:hypothetical protein [Myxococcales bacterium]